MRFFGYFGDILVTTTQFFEIYVKFWSLLSSTEIYGRRAFTEDQFMMLEDLEPITFSNRSDLKKILHKNSLNVSH